MILHGGLHQRDCAVLVLRVDVGTCFQERGDHRGVMVILCGKRQRGCAVLVLRLNVRTSLQEYGDHLGVWLWLSATDEAQLASVPYLWS